MMARYFYSKNQRYQIKAEIPPGNFCLEHGHQPWTLRQYKSCGQLVYTSPFLLLTAATRPSHRGESLPPPNKTKQDTTCVALVIFARHPPQQVRRVALPATRGAALPLSVTSPHLVLVHMEIPYRDRKWPCKRTSQPLVPPAARRATTESRPETPPPRTGCRTR